MYDIITLYNILNSKIDTPELLQSVNINVPGYVTTRSTMPFRPPFVRTNYLQNSPIIRFQRSANLIREHLDLFFTSASAIKQFYLNQLEETGSSQTARVLVLLHQPSPFLSVLGDVLPRTQFNKVRVGGELSTAFTVESGLKQGDGLSPLLFNVTLQKVIQDIWKDDSLVCELLAYADDIAN
ncbi:hypothetical protein M8J77_017625 [Diaphorina citri]|nr:hypothetical protein M8J77_017625 [Diaphorina citri]